MVFPLSGYAPPLRYAFYLFGIYAVFMLCLVMAEAGALGNFLMGRVGGSARHGARADGAPWSATRTPEDSAKPSCWRM